MYKLDRIMLYTFLTLAFLLGYLLANLITIAAK